MSAPNSNALIGAFYIWPQFGVHLSHQWDRVRENFENLTPIIRGMQIALDASENHEPKDNDLSGLAHGERDFRNRWRIWYDNIVRRWALQKNSGTEAAPQWDDYLTVRDSDGRVTVHNFGGLDSSVGGFYSPLPRNLAVSSTFNPPSFEWVFEHDLNTKPILWDAYNLEDKSVTPLSVDVSNPNIAYFYFSQPQAGRAIAVAEAARGEGIRISDGTNIFDGATRLGFNPDDFYLSNDGHGKPVVNLQQIDITQFDTSGLVHVDGSTPFTADQSMGGHKLTNVGTPVSAGDAVPKSYADALAVDIGLSNGVGPTFTNASKITFRQEDFYFDTDSSGQPIVNIRGGAGGGSGGGQFGTGIFAQDFSSSSEWILNHGLGVANIIWSTYDDQGLAIIPDKVSVHNSNTAYFYFLPATSGRAVVGGGPVFQSSGSITIGETDGNPPDFSAATKLLFNSNDFYIASDSSGKPIVNFRGTIDNSFLKNVVEDLTPQLGGDLDVNNFDITSVNGGDIEIRTGLGPLFSGQIYWVTGDVFYSQSSGAITASTGVVEDGLSGAFQVSTGNASGNGSTGNFEVGVGATFGSGTAGNLRLIAGQAVGSGAAGSTTIQSGSAAVQRGGDILLEAGTGGAGDGCVRVTGNINAANSTITANAFYLTSGSGGELFKQGNDIVLRSNNGVVIIDDDVTITGTLTGGNISGGSGGGFYGIIIRETDGNPPAYKNDTITFDSAAFYIQSDSKGKPIISFRGSSSSAADTGIFILADGSRKFTGTLKSSLHVERVVVADAFYLTPGSGGEFSKSGNDVILASKDGGVSVLAEGDGGSINLTAGGDPTFSNNFNGSNINITTGFAHDDAGQILIQSGNSFYGFGGTILLLAGSGAGGDGSVEVGTGGNGGFSVSAGSISLASSDLVGGVNVNSSPITNVLDPTNPQDAATKNYVDTNGGITHIIQDATPTLGANLNVNDKTITGPGDIDITGNANINILGANDGSGNGGISIQTGAAFYTNASTAGITINPGTSSTGSGGDVTISGGIAVTSGNGGSISILGGDTNSGVGGTISITPGTSVLGTQGNVEIGLGGALGSVVDILDPVNAHSNLIHNVTDPVSAQDAATKNYVDTHISGSGSPGFYGVIWSDGVVTKRTDRLSFNNLEFYLDGRKPTLNIKESGIDHNLLANLTAGDPHTQYIRTDGTRAFTGDESHGGFKITNLGAPSSPTDAARLGDITPAFYGLIVKQTVAGTTFKRDTLIFGANDFYLKANSKGYPTVNLRGSSGVSISDGVHSFSNKLKINLNPNQFYLSQNAASEPVVNLRYEKDIYPIFVELGSICNVVVDPFAQYPYTLEYADMDCRSGSATGGFYLIKSTNPNGLGVRIGRGQPIPGMDQLAINQTPRRVVPTSGNSVNPGDCVLFTVFGNSSSKHIRVSLVAKKP